jgi:hypothetical protein
MVSPKILGHHWSSGSIEILVDGFPFNGVLEIAYSPTTEVGDVRGIGSYSLGYTRGKVTFEGSMRMLLAEWEALRDRLGPRGVGYMERTFMIVVARGELLSPVKVDNLIGCRITKVEYSDSMDSVDASAVALTFSIMRIMEGGTAMPVATRGVI